MHAQARLDLLQPPQTHLELWEISLVRVLQVWPIGYTT